jgi:sec-independent protein translocase protein TatA
MGPIGFQELLVILAILVLIFGATKLPQLGRGLGEGIRNFKKGLKSDDQRELEESKETAP